MIIDRKDAQAAWTPSTPPANVTMLKTCAEANQATEEAMVTSATPECLDDLIDRLKKLYLAQCDRADVTLRSLIRATHERRTRNG